MTWIPGPRSHKWVLDMLGNWEEFHNDPNGSGYSEVEERTHNAANEITTREPLGWPASVPFTHDDAGNRRTAYSIGPSYKDIYTHDAWNRLVKHEIDADGFGLLQHAEYEYNALHWRTVKRHNGLLGGPAQERVMYYSAAWQLIEEHIDDEFDQDPGVNRIALQLWGLRYIDDAVMRRLDVNWEVEEPYAELDYYYITDAQFSTVALIGTGIDPLVYERVRYTAYGEATHRWPGDFDGDGYVDSSDENMYFNAWMTALGDQGYNADIDLNRDGAIDDSDYDQFVLWENRIPLAAGAISNPAAIDNPIGYSGYMFSGEVAIYLSRFRWYEPKMGRWVERDPAGAVDGVHLYQYVRSTPTRWSDSSGLKPPPEDDWWQAPDGSMRTGLLCPPRNVNGGSPFRVTENGEVYNPSGDCRRSASGYYTAPPFGPAPPTVPVINSTAAFVWYFYAGTPTGMVELSPRVDEMYWNNYSVREAQRGIRRQVETDIRQAAWKACREKGSGTHDLALELRQYREGRDTTYGEWLIGDPTDPLYSLGNGFVFGDVSDLEVTVECDGCFVKNVSASGGIRFSSHDVFEQPLGVPGWNVGGTPYLIWIEPRTEELQCRP